MQKWILRGRRLLDYVFKHSRIQLFAIDCRTRPPAPIPRLDVVREQTTAGVDPEATQRHERGDVCYRVNDGGRCVHYSWVAMDRMHISEVGYDAVLPKTHRWIYDSFTAATHHGQAIFPRVLLTLIQDAHDAGVETLWIGVKMANSASLHSILKAGFIEAAQLERIQLFSCLRLRRHRMILETPFGAAFRQMPYRWTAAWK